MWATLDLLNSLNVTFIVEAEGANLSYQWLCRAPGSRNFEYLTGETSPTLRVEMTAESEGAEYRCFITDAHGDMGSTRIATVKLDTRDWQMEYNTSGLRTRRISDDKTYRYIYAGDKLMRMTVGDDILDFSYDANGAPLTMTYNGTVYYYITNLQGDVMSLERADGGSGASYAYDAWGNILAMSGTLAELNPLRYRGYVYDQETGFYYLNSRYYDPAVGRFINPDAAIGQVGNIKGNNMFTYALNNPVMYSDLTGNWPKLSTVLAGVAAVAAIVAVAAAVVATCGAAIPAVAAGGSLALGLSAGSAASAIATTALAVAGATAIASATSYALEKIAADSSKRDNSVYVLVDEGGTVQYVGRTKNVERRREAHSQNPARSGLRMDVIASGLNHSESRALEQAGMAYYHTINTVDKMNNQKDIAEKSKIHYEVDEYGFLPQYRTRLISTSAKVIPSKLVYLGNFAEADPPKGEFIPHANVNIDSISWGKSGENFENRMIEKYCGHNLRELKIYSEKRDRTPTPEENCTRGGEN